MGDVDSFEDPSSLIPDEIINVLVKSIGLGLDHRPYEPATPLGTFVGLDISAEVTLAQLPKDFAEVMDSAGGAGGGALPFGFIPSPKLHLHKGFTNRLDLGVSGLYYPGFLLLGGDAKLAVYMPEEGPTWAIRLGYSYTSLGIITTHTWSPQILLSKKLHFTDPYIGVGYQYTYGTLELDLTEALQGQVPEDAPPEIAEELENYDFVLSKDGSGSAFIGFLGLGIKLGPSGVRVSVEASYSTARVNTIGTKVGFNF